MPLTGIGQVESKRDTHYDDLNEVIAKHSYGRHELPVVLLTSPEEKYRARVAKQENVDALEQSLLQFGTVNEHVDVVLFSLGTKPLPPKPGFKVPLTAEEIKQRGFEGYFVICGDHTARAMNQLHRKFKANPKWATLTATVHVCPRSTEVYSALKSWGILDNVKGEKRVSVSFLDKITALHDDYMSLAEFTESAGHKERTAQLKARRCKDFNMSPGQMMQLWSLAARANPVWELLLKIIKGDITPPAQLKSNSSRRTAQRKGAVKDVKSAAPFTNIGGVEDDVLVSLLNQVIAGQVTLQRLNDLCALVKARMRVQTAVLMDSKVQEESWVEAQKKFPQACNDEFVERWAVCVQREGIKQKDSLPELFFTDLARRIDTDLSKSRAAREVQLTGCH